jgi:PAS domain S-box-containing protein
MVDGVAVPARVAVAVLALAGMGLAAWALWRRSRRSRQALRLSEERLRLALEATSEIVWDWNLADDSIYHPRWAPTYGYPQEKAPRTGGELGRFIHPEDMPVFGGLLEEAVEGKRDAFEFEHRALAASGEWRWMTARARVVSRDENGRGLRMVGTCTDISEHRKLAAQLRIADRLASMGALAAGVAHEINNPLAFAMGNVHFAIATLGRADAAFEAGAPPDVLRQAVAQCREALQEALGGAQRVRDIVRDLKVLSRADDERRTPLAVAKVLRAALNLAAGEISSRARVVTEIEEVPPVLASESRLSQVFLNLLVNAAQSIPEGRAEQNTITVSVRSGTEHRVVVEVRDTGCGISPEHHRRIFDPFFTTKPPGVGTGLGLAICHGIVSALGGEIDVESEVGRGSTFRVALPAAAGSVAVDTETPLPGPPPRRARVLVVDDEPLFCRTMERLLRSEHEVVSVTDPRQALRRVRGGEHFDAVLSDLVMPGMSGMDLHAEIAKFSSELGERMIFVTGGAFTQAASEFAARWPDRVLDKPVSPERVRAALFGILERAPGRGAPPAAGGGPEDLAREGRDS